MKLSAENSTPYTFALPKMFHNLRQNIAAYFVLATLIGMVAGWFLERQGMMSRAWLFYAVAFVAGGYDGTRGAISALWKGVIDVDLLMILAAIGAAIVGEPFEGTLLLFLFSLSNLLQDYALERTRKAIEALAELRPNRANVKQGEALVLTPIEQVPLDAVFVVKPGERIPLDGVVVLGESNVDQASITGESLPISKEVGSIVFASTININGHLEIRVTHTAEDSTVAKLIKMVSTAQDAKANTQRWIDQFEQWYAKGIILFVFLLIVIPYFVLQHPFNSTFYRAMTVLVAASPCALVISTPATVLSGIANAGRRGILFKGGVHLERAATITAVTLDKTGTLTLGKPQVTDVVVWGEESAETLLRDAAAVETKSEHPLAKSVVLAATRRGLIWPETTNFQSMAGSGVRAMVAGDEVAVLNPRDAQLLPEHQSVVRQLQDQGKTVVYVSRNGLPAGVLAIADVVRPESADIVRQLHENGVKKVVMLTGDNPRVAKTIAQQVGIDAVFGDLLPEDKVKVIETLLAEGHKVAMVGDGVNDAPALATATLGIAMGAAGTDVALESADVVLMGDNLQHIAYLLRLAKATQRVLYTNLAISIGAILLMLGAIFLYKLPLPLAVIGHEGGTVLVSLNGLRLLAFGAREK